MIRLETNRSDFLDRIASIDSAVMHRQLVDEDLKGASKRSLYYLILCIVRPIFSLCGKDIFKRYRMERVVPNLVRYIELNAQYIAHTEQNERMTIYSPTLLENIANIANRLNEKTRQRYETSFNRIHELLRPHLESGQRVRDEFDAWFAFAAGRGGIPAGIPGMPQRAQDSHGPSLQAQLEEIFECQVSTQEELNTAFRRWAFRHHPDRQRDRLQEATENFARVSSLVREYRESRGWS